MEITNLKSGKSYRKILKPLSNFNESEATVPIDMASLNIEVAELKIVVEEAVPEPEPKVESKLESKLVPIKELKKISKKEYIPIKVIDPNHNNDDHIHLGHYHKFYIDDEKMTYVVKVLVTSGATYVLKKAFHSILDGYIWETLGLPVIAILLPLLSKLFLSIKPSINPTKLLSSISTLTLPNLSNLFKKSNFKHQSQIEQKKKSTNDFKVFGLKLQKRRLKTATKYGLLIWLVFRIISPLTNNLNNGKIILSQESTPINYNEKQIIASNTKELESIFVSTKTYEKKNDDATIVLYNKINPEFDKNRNENNNLNNIVVLVDKPKKIEKIIIKRTNPFQKLNQIRVRTQSRIPELQVDLYNKMNIMWRNSSVRKTIAEKIFSAKKRELGVPRCPLRQLIEDS